MGRVLFHTLILKCSSAFLLGTFFPVVLAGDQTTDLECAGITCISQHVWLPLAFFFFFLRASSPASLLSCIHMQKPFGALYWRHLLWFLYCFSCLISGNIISLQVCHAPHLKNHIQEERPDSKWKACWGLSEGSKHQDPKPQQACPWAGLSSVLAASSLWFSLSLLPKPFCQLINSVTAASISIPQPAVYAVCQNWQSLLYRT